jgi:hypothetical protein
MTVSGYLRTSFLFPLLLSASVLTFLRHAGPGYVQGRRMDRAV